jgi:ribose 5-phosphate isomerase A
MSFEQAKRNAGVYAVDFIKTEMAVGLGSGTTVYWLIQELGKRVREGLQITAVPTSSKTADLARAAGIVLSDLDSISSLSLTIDGADEIDPRGQLIKGGGGALLQEKIVAAATAELIIIADASKLVPQLGKFPLPVEVIPFGYQQVKEKILNGGLCKNITLRKQGNEVFITDHHHYILDCEFEKIANAEELNTSLHLIPGVVETGLFISMATTAIIGHEDGRIEVINYERANKT